MFDTALTENVNNTRLADGIKMTANACTGVTHTGDHTELGSYDANESGWQNDEHTVYRHRLQSGETLGHNQSRHISHTADIL